MRQESITKSSLPRPQPRTPSDGSLEGLLLVGCIVWISGSLLALIFAAFSMLPGWVRYWRLYQFGELTMGRVIRQDEGLNWYAYLYEFSARAAPEQPVQTFTGQQAVPPAQFDPLPAGARVPVRYLAADPRLSAIEPYFRAPTLPPLLFVAVGLPALLLGLALLPGRWRVWRRIYRLRNQGDVVPAKIINRWRTVDSHDRDLYCVAYQFSVHRPDASLRTIVSAEDNFAAYEMLQIGDTTPVHYLPDQPDFCFLETGWAVG